MACFARFRRAGECGAEKPWLIDQPLKFLLFTQFTTYLVLVTTPCLHGVAIWISAELVDRRLIEAARDLGARPIEAFVK